MAILAGNTFNVRDFSPALWLDASDSNTLFDAVSGGALVGAGGAVARWEDKSGNARHATQATLANRPLRTVGAQNTRDALRFDGSSSFMFAGSNTDWSFLHNGTAASVFIAVKTGLNNDPNVVYSFLSTGGEASADTGYFLGYDDRSQFSRNNAVASLISRGVITSYAVNAMNLNILIPDQFNIISNEVDADNATASNRSIVRVNDASESKINTLTNTPSLNISSSYKMTIGAYLNGTSGFLAGNIAEIIVFPTALSTAQRQSIERYLANKWGLGFNPLSLSPSLWLDASDSNTLYDATIGGALVGAGGAVARWEDKSGNARHATQAALANRPLRTAAVQGGRDALRFDGIDDTLTITNGGTIFRNVSSGTVFAIVRPNIAGTGERNFFSNLANAGSNRFTCGINRVSSQWIYGGRRLDNDSFQFNDVIGHDANSYYTFVAQLRWGLAERQLWINGVSLSNVTGFQTAGNTSDTNGNGTFIGANAGINQYFLGNIAEIIVFNYQITTAQRQAVERYLAQKWNIIP